MHTTFSQLDHRQERNQQYQRWLNCEQLLPGRINVPPPPRVDLRATVALIRELLPTSYTLQIDVSGDMEAVDLIRAQLTPEENARVQFSTR
jgi:hypothetical protein